MGLYRRYPGTWNRKNRGRNPRPGGSRELAEPGFTDTVLITHNLHLFLDLPEVIQAIINGIVKWKSTGCCLVMVSPRVQLGPEIEKFFHVIDLPLPETESLYDLQCEMGREVNVKPNKKAAQSSQGTDRVRMRNRISPCHWSNKDTSQPGSSPKPKLR